MDSLYNQFERFFVYLNHYETVPDWLDDPKFTVFRSQDYIDLNATGKVFFAQVVDKGYYFTLDDDFVYPGDYVKRHIQTLARYNYNVATCVHGSIFPPDPEYYYMRSAIHQYQGALQRDQFVCMPGTGSFCVQAGKLDMSLRQFLPQVMVDLACAILCKNTGVPLVSLARHERWMQNTDREGLYQEFSKEKTHHTFYAKEQGPWGFAEYAKAIRSVEESVIQSGGDLMNDSLCDIDCLVAARENTIPVNWSDTPQHYNRMAEYIRSQIHSFRV